MPTMKGSYPTAWGVLGKHPSQADFVRSNAGGDTATELHRYLETAVELLHRQKQPMKFEPLRFFFAPKATGTALLGVLRPSAEKVGRQFPLAVFLELPLTSLSTQLAEVAVFGAPAFEAMNAMLDGAIATKEAIDPKVQGIAVPDPTTGWSDAGATVRARLAETKVEGLHALFAEGAVLTGYWYAVRTVLQAAEARKKAPAAAPTLDIPLSPAFGAVPWLALMAKGNPGQPPPSCFWSTSRLFVGLGALPAAIFQAFVGVSFQSSKVWPLTTSQQSAVDGARTALRSVSALTRPEATFDEILSALVVKT